MTATLFTSAELPALPADGVEATGFQIGWDHAHHGLVPPPELLLDGTPLGQGWRAGKAVFGHRVLPAQRSTRRWLALRDPGLAKAFAEGLAIERVGKAAPGLATGPAVAGSVDLAFAPLTHPARNVVAILRGSDPKRNQTYAALTAHSDHVVIWPSSATVAGARGPPCFLAR